jgi:hypothetical protein
MLSSDVTFHCHMISNLLRFNNIINYKDKIKSIDPSLVEVLDWGNSILMSAFPPMAIKPHYRLIHFTLIYIKTLIFLKQSKIGTTYLTVLYIGIAKL